MSYLPYTLAQLEHTLTAGQSLSIGSQGQPSISTVSERANARFIDAAGALGNMSGSSQRPDLSMSYRVGEQFPTTQAMGFTTHGLGGNNIGQLSPGGSSGKFEEAIARVQAARNARVAASQTYRVRALHWIQGEADQEQGLPRASYIAALAALYEAYKSSVLGITGLNNFPMIVSQMATWAYYGTPAMIGPAQLDAARTIPGVFLACPQYQLPSAADNLHLNPVGYYRLGEYHARVQAAVVDGAGWAPFAPTSITYEDDTVTVVYHVPVPPLQFDTTFIAAQPNMGFSLEGTDATISSVEITAPDAVVIHVSGRMYEATAALGYGVAHGTYRGLGNLRDSETAVSVYDGAALANWAVHSKDSFGLPGKPPFTYRVRDRFLVGPGGRGLYRINSVEPA